MFGPGVDEREPQPEAVLELACGGQLRRGVVQPDGPRAAAASQADTYPVPAAQLDAVAALQVRGSTPACASATAQMPQAESAASQPRRPAAA
jgi:hypothetical protein